MSQARRSESGFQYVLQNLLSGAQQPRTSLGWEFDHVFGYFIITLLILFAWPQPFVVAPVLMIFAMALEALQGLTPDRSPNLWAALYGAAGVLMAASVVELFIRTKRRQDSRTVSG
jgi:VanZ family protein